MIVITLNDILTLIGTACGLILFIILLMNGAFK